MKTVLEDVEFTAKAYPKALAAYENENGDFRRDSFPGCGFEV